MKFKIGDRVIAIENEGSFRTKDKVGTILQHRPDMKDYSAYFDYNVDGWVDMYFGIPYGHGLYVGEKNVTSLTKVNKRTRGFEIVTDEKRKHPEVEIQPPTRGSKHAIAYDIYSPIDTVIQPMEKELIWTDVKAYFNEDEALLINVRSSMGSHPVIMSNVQGWVECDYYNNPKNDGNLGINLLNLGTEPYIIKKGDRIGQAMFIPFLVADSGNTEAVRMGGHGSTGK